MRTYLILIVAALFLQSCGECACKMGEANVAIVEALYGDFAAGNIEGVVGKMSPDIEWNEAENYIYADNNPYVGPDAVLQGVFGRIGSEWTTFGVKDPKVMPVGANHVLATGRYQGQHKASGKTLDAQFAHLWGISEGLAISFQQYTDTKQAAEVATTEEVTAEGEE